MTNTLRSPAVVRRPATCTCRQTNADLPRRRKWLLKLFSTNSWFYCKIFQVSKETSATRFEAVGRFKLRMAFVGHHGRRIIEGYTQIVTLSFIKRESLRWVKEDKLRITARYAGSFLSFANNLSGKLSTIPDRQLSITCGLCKHHTRLEVAKLIAAVGGDTTGNEVCQRARCNNCDGRVTTCIRSSLRGLKALLWMDL